MRKWMGVLNSVTVIVMLGAGWTARGQEAKTPYPNMAALDQYLMETNAEIALARSAAPEAISGDAEVMVLARHGYETAAKGKNGFVCMVLRSWTAGIDDPDFWNPKLRVADLFQRVRGAIVSSSRDQEDEDDSCGGSESEDV